MSKTIKLAIGAVIVIAVFAGAKTTNQTSKINNQNPTGCAYGDSIPVDSEKCSAENFADKTTTIEPTTLPSVGGSGR